MDSEIRDLRASSSEDSTRAENEAPDEVARKTSDSCAGLTTVFKKTLFSSRSLLHATLFGSDPSQRLILMKSAGCERIQIGAWTRGTDDDKMRIVSFWARGGAALLFQRLRITMVEKHSDTGCECPEVDAYVCLTNIISLQTKIRLKYIIKTTNALCSLDVTGQVNVGPAWNMFPWAKAWIVHEMLQILVRPLHQLEFLQAGLSIPEEPKPMGTKFLLVAVIVVLILSVLRSGHRSETRQPEQRWFPISDNQSSKVQEFINRNWEHYRELLELYTENNIAIQFKRRGLDHETRHTKRVQKLIVDRLGI